MLVRAQRAWAAALACTCLLVAGCDGSRPELAYLEPDAVVLAFGDSLTFGTGVERDRSYPAVLERGIGREVVNAGVPGEVTADGLRRLPDVLFDEAPQLVVLCHGGNDMLRKLNPGATERNLRAMIEHIRRHGAEVVLIGVPAPGLWLTTAEVYENLAEELEVALEAAILPDVLGDNRFKSDQIHPNAEGYARMARAVEDLLRRDGAL